MLVNLKEILAPAVEGGYAVGAFNVANLESVQAITRAAEETGKPVIMEWALAHEPLIFFDEIAPIMLQYAERASVPICVHLDHGPSMEWCMKAIRAGFTSVMLDNSAAPYEDNVRDTELMCRLAHSVGVSVEAELGSILTSDVGVGEAAQVLTDETYERAGDIYTDPATAKDFVSRTGVDALAIAFGTAHGLYTVKPRLDLERISAIREQVDVPFVMHGGSGLSKEEFQTSIRNGVRKINFYTYMSLYGGEMVKEELDRRGIGDNVFFHELPLIGVEAMKDKLVETIRVFSLED